MKMFIVRHTGHYLSGVSLVFAETEQRASEMMTENLIALGIAKQGDNDIIFGVQRVVRPTEEKIIMLENGDY